METYVETFLTALKAVIIKIKLETRQHNKRQSKDETLCMKLFVLNVHSYYAIKL